MFLSFSLLPATRVKPAIYGKLLAACAPILASNRNSIKNQTPPCCTLHVHETERHSSHPSITPTNTTMPRASVPHTHTRSIEKNEPCQRGQRGKVELQYYLRPDFPLEPKRLVFPRFPTPALLDFALPSWAAAAAAAAAARGEDRSSGELSPLTPEEFPPLVEAFPDCCRGHRRGREATNHVKLFLFSQDII